MATETMVQPDEISQILKQQLLGFEKEIDVFETGTVLYVGDGTARVHGLSNVRATELVNSPTALWAWPSTSKKTTSAVCSSARIP